MRKVAVFGNAGGGKSTLSRKLAASTGLPLHALDQIKFRPGGGEVAHEEYLKVHDELVASDEWIIDGFGSIDTIWKRLDAADTLIYIDLPLTVHYWRVVKRLLRSSYAQPEGWPEKSPMLWGTWNGLVVIGRCNTRLTPLYRKYVHNATGEKDVFHLETVTDIDNFASKFGN